MRFRNSLSGGNRSNQLVETAVAVLNQKAFCLLSSVSLALLSLDQAILALAHLGPAKLPQTAQASKFDLLIKLI